MRTFLLYGRTNGRPTASSTSRRAAIGPRRTAAWSFVILTAFPTVLLLAGTSTLADTSTTMSATLPTGRIETSAVWDGTNAYIFGGYDNSPLNQIVRYNPATDTVTTMSATLPTTLYSSSAVWDGSNAYIFGGWHYDTNSPLNQIVRYNPATDTVTTMSATLPTALSATSAVWDGTNAYIFGGLEGLNGPASKKVVRYNPATDTATTMSATLPTVRIWASAVWDGSNAYIFGGYGAGQLNQIVRYNPATDTVTTMSATLPTPRSRTSAVWDGSDAYIFGGTEYPNGPVNQEIVRYNPATNTVTIMSNSLPTARFATSAVWGAANAYIFGGWEDDTSLSFLNQVVRYNPATPTAPRSLTAIPGPGVGQITLNWQAPTDAGSSSVTGYRIYRGTASGTETFLEEVGNVLTYTDNTCGSVGTICYYTVRAVNAAGESPGSNEDYMLATGLPAP